MATLRLASFNVENLFERPRAMNLGTWAKGRPILERHARINELINEDVYTPAIKKEILKLITDLGLKGRDDAGKFAHLRQIRGDFLKRKPLRVVADGRADWIGWVELKTEPINDVAMRHTAEVIKDVNADVLGVIEADNRISLNNFSAQSLKFVKGTPYDRVMLVDGNDERGIDVALLTRLPYEIIGIRTHFDDVDDIGQIFSRDCPEYLVDTPSGQLVILVNHLKSKGYGDQASNNARRRRQAVRVAAIYQRLKDEGKKAIAILGDFNDTPSSAPLAPLLANTDLKDISDHPQFDDGGKPGTYGTGLPTNKIDYILLSPDLYARMKSGAIFRKGVWGGKNGTMWPHYDSMTRSVHQASDHAAIYADIDL